MTLSASALRKSVVHAALLALVIVLGGLFLLNHVPQSKRDAVADGLLADIVLTFPLGFYFLVIRRLKLRLRSMILVFSCCCGVAWLVLPAHQQHYILQLRKLTFLIELGVMGYALSKIKKINAHYQSLQAALPDSAYNLQQSLVQVLGDGLAARMLASELGMIRYGLLWWKKSKPFPAGYISYSTHKQSGYAALFGIVLFVSLLEITVVHLLLIKYSPVAAWIVSAVSIYGTLFIIGDFAALVKQPVLIKDNQLLLRTGIRWRCATTSDDIAAIEIINDNYELSSTCFKGGVMKNSINVLITFKEPVTIQRMYRKPVTRTQIALSIDNASEFKNQLQVS